MKLYTIILFPIWIFLFGACADNSHYTGASKDIKADSAITANNDPLPHTNAEINTGSVNPLELVHYAEGLMGIPYKYGSINPDEGFDCSGFITYVFNNFGVSVPRSSRDFTDVERKINIREAKPGDLILFTGTDSTIREVGHMGIITDNNGLEISFIHSTSGKAYGVTKTPLNKYYQGRFVKAIRIFKSNDIK